LLARDANLLAPAHDDAMATEAPAFVVREFGLLARRIGPTDAHDWFEFAAMQEVRQHTSLVVDSLSDLQAAIGRTLVQDPGSPVYFAVRDERSSELVAVIGFHSRSAINRSAEINYEVRPSHWGRGVATAVCREAVHWGFSKLGLVRVQATAVEENLASQRVLRKAGFELEGRLRNFRIVRGNPKDYLVFSRLPGAPS